MMSALNEKTKSYIQSAQTALKWLESKVQQDGSLLDAPKDLACYYKAPTLFMQHGKIELAHLVLDFIKQNFMQSDGDFITSKDCKSANGAFQEFWAYPNGWIVQAAQRMGRFDVSFVGWKYLQNYFSSQLGGWKTHRKLIDSLDILTTAHLGLVSLHMGDLNKAEKSGLYLQSVYEKQSAKTNKFYLRTNTKGELITNLPKDMAIFEHVDQHTANQAYFMLGYPIAFLTKLYLATQNNDYLQTAKSYFDWTNKCTGNLKSFFFSHKVAWGAACLAKITHDPEAFDLSKHIANYLISIQEKDGSWLSNQDVLTHYDQTAEICIWLTEIARNGFDYKAI